MSDPQNAPPAPGRRLNRRRRPLLFILLLVLFLLLLPAPAAAHGGPAGAETHVASSPFWILTLIYTQLLLAPLFGGWLLVQGVRIWTNGWPRRGDVH